MSDIWSSQTLWNALKDTAITAPGLPCLSIPSREERDYHREGLLWSYGAVAERVGDLIDQYSAKGYGHGHRVSLLLENRPEFMLHFLALNALGCWVIPLNPDFRQDDLAHIMGHSDVDLVVTLGQHAGNLEAARDSLGRSTPIVDVDTFESALTAATRLGRNAPPGRESEAVLMYTSGTTGMPKGCIISNEYFFFAAERYLGAGGTMTMRIGEERLYNPLPLP